MVRHEHLTAIKTTMTNPVDISTRSTAITNPITVVPHRTVELPVRPPVPAKPTTVRSVDCLVAHVTVSLPVLPTITRPARREIIIDPHTTTKQHHVSAHVTRYRILSH